MAKKANATAKVTSYIAWSVRPDGTVLDSGFQPTREEADENLERVKREAGIKPVSNEPG